jgi:hypothetical protein
MWGSIIKALTQFKPAIEGVAAVTSAVAPIFMQSQQNKLPDQASVKTAEEYEAEQSAAATERRREIASRKGTESTYRIPRLGLSMDVSVRKPTVRGL